MDKASRILTEISTVARDIEENYPELQKYLDETQDTLPEGANTNAKMDEKSLETYLNTLKEMIKKYEEEH
ncbi:hypothetical protein ESY86_12645 [Subsaximicrobium wynnwilliamsii]|jgi:sugar-specific transcriptional regulator TrmB|uniref:Uncharacterized protein n=1 Tax=Subsaximicrobium wynnwilliamsii TaxID=291179 RepID=A0A5C6ZFG3_9FLAO|nr:hypothetical protein [Subsaximicrobium wynnwilliamsii]TXD82628.1 hypothetical protein ESY87_12685 [Subsaximicrobium wynnwilliamsii]TXD88363.1 hypothetical protein ESY86_12645 [Subsaximicrobium wynnwilliamsii]TXE02290.1 hypothetical protein ESY88_12255 [Subsaximicrobium wynnwilliamsii]